MSEQPCAFHPDRLTGVSCARCERPICPDDMIPAAVGFQCPVCAGRMSSGALGETAYRARTRIERHPIGRQLMGAEITSLIIGANVVVFVLMLLGGGLTGRALLRFGALTKPLPASQWWRVITATFLHFSIMHIFFNMFALTIFAGPIERRYRKIRFLAMYLASGVLGSAFSLAFGGRGLRAGASGAVFGIMGAWLALAIFHRRMPAMRGQVRSWLFLIALNIFFSHIEPAIDLHAHLGGLVGGFVIACALEASQFVKGPARRAIQALGYIAIALVSYALIAAHVT